MSAVPDGEWFCPKCLLAPGAPIGALPDPSKKTVVKKAPVKKVQVQYIDDDGIDDEVDDRRRKNPDSSEDSDDAAYAGRKRKATTKSRSARESLAQVSLFIRRKLTLYIAKRQR